MLDEPPLIVRMQEVSGLMGARSVLLRRDDRRFAVLNYRRCGAGGLLSDDHDNIR
jgi:hypothetical protein